MMFAIGKNKFCVFGVIIAKQKALIFMTESAPLLS